MGLHRFPPFEFDRASLQLRKHGARLKLQRKPALILAALLEHPGEPISRKDLYARLWPSDTFVDFDLSLNVAIKKLRDCLGDSAEQPRFIETVAGYGYRFIATFELPARVETATPLSTPDLALASPVPRRFRVLSTAISGLALFGVAYALVAFSTHPPTYHAANFRQITRSGTEKTPFATDGERIYFFESRADKTLFTQVSVNGGEELHIPASANVLPYQADVLDDRLVYLDGKWSAYFQPSVGVPVWIRQLPAGTPSQVPDVRCQSISWTSDGKLLCTLNGEFRIIDLDGKLVHKLFKIDSIAYRAHLSPDQKRVRFDTIEQGPQKTSGAIWDAAIDGSNLHRIAPALSTCCGNWSPDGSLYVFEAWNQSTWDIWAVPEAGYLSSRSQPFRLTSGPLDARYPMMSADGKQVYFMGADFRGELSTIDEKTGHLVPYLTGESITQVDLSPDHRWITYIAYPEGTLWRSRADGTERVQLTHRPLLPFNPKFSTDGSRIYFSDIGGTDKIYVVPAGGGAMTALSQANPKCLSEESAIVDFAFWTMCSSESGKEVIRVIDPGRRKSWTVPDSDGLANPTLSPDAQAIAAIERRSGYLKVFKFKRRQWLEIRIPFTSNPGGLAWSPHSEFIYVRQGDTILRCSVHERRATVLTIIPKSSTRLWWGDWFGVDPDGKVLLTRQTGAGDIYAFELQRQ